MRKVGLNGFGRIGRRLLRLMDDGQRSQVVAINEIADSRMLAHLFKYDSTHGRFDGAVENDEESITINGHRILVLNKARPSDLPWGDLGVEVVVESTGFLRDREGNSQHLVNGAKKVIATGLLHQPDLMLVRGVNDGSYDPDHHHLISIGAGITNLVAPMIKLIHDQFGIERGRITTLLAMSPDQRILDGPHYNLYRGRSAAENVIPSDLDYTASTIGQVIPELMGKLTAGLGYRIPIACGYLGEVHLELTRGTEPNAVNSLLREAAAGLLRGVLAYTEEPIVSSDIVGNPHSCVVDGSWTSVHGNRLMLLGWQDNETACARAAMDVISIVQRTP
ncbi:MAG: glyceraldehyde 3-phosphate dehydrogenase [Verrucomicrobiales bacterium]|jgi:glyceraldehyde 3-phosphate dehydrogenase